MDVIGQISLFDYMPVRQPCNRPCECEWCSMTCFEKRGQVYDRVHRKWVRDINGNILIGKKECDYEENDRGRI